MKDLKLFDADGVALSADELEGNLVFLRMDEDKLEELWEALEEAESIRGLKNTSFILTSHDIEISIARRDDLTLMAAKKISKTPKKTVVIDG